MELRHERQESEEKLVWDPPARVPGGSHASMCVDGKRALKVSRVHNIKMILILGIQTLLPRDW